MILLIIFLLCSSLLSAADDHQKIAYGLVYYNTSLPVTTLENLSGVHQSEIRNASTIIKELKDIRPGDKMIPVVICDTFLPLCELSYDWNAMPSSQVGYELVPRHLPESVCHSDATKIIFNVGNVLVLLLKVPPIRSSR